MSDSTGRAGPVRPWPLVAALAVSAAIIGWLLLRSPTGPESTPAIGPGDACRAQPRFVASLNVGPDAAIGTSLTDVEGLAILKGDGSGGRADVYQHPTWDDAGFLGPFITDRDGNVYVAPAPLVSLVENPPELQNRVYKVDTNTQELGLLSDLPASSPPSPGNPFGVVGLAYDCGTHSLYATSIAGSTAGQEKGRIFRIDPATGAVTSTHDGLDAMGLAVLWADEGARLYFGRVREPAVASIALDENGDMVGEARPELTFSDHVSGGRRTVRRIRFLPGPELVLHVMDFNYSLQIASERLEDVLTYRRDEASGQWVYAGTARAE